MGGVSRLLTSLRIQHLRNISAARLDVLGRHNILFGANGSGKTSVLEAVHMLGTARSFRGGTVKTLITHGEQRVVLFGETSLPVGGGRALGVQREIDGGVSLKISGASVRSVAALADELPLLVINSSSFDLLIGLPTQRRRFLDWGVFHVEHDYREHLRRFQRILTQRNHVLRHARLANSEVDAWTRDLALHGEAVSAGRERFLEVLLPRFYALMLVLAPEIDDIAVSYRRGWDASVSYSEALKRGLTADREHGFTRAGPQRADLRFSVGGYSAAETLSRGQQKLLVCALKLAQGAVLSSRHSRRSLYLIDDLPSELDAARCERVCRSIAGMSAQTLITCVDRQSLPAEWLGEKNEIAMFHVEQGEVRPEACS